MQSGENDATLTTPVGGSLGGIDPGSPLLGSSLGKYRLLRVIGEGGMGRVFEAEDQESARIVALKVSHSKFNDSHRERLLHEAQFAASISHPNCVFVFGSDEVAGAVVIAMELVRGGTLKDRVQSEGPLPPSEAVRVALGVIDGLDAAHQKGILHREVKPANIFLDATTGSAKIGDFGMSMSHELSPGAPPTSPSSSSFAGTPAYASPEQLQGQTCDLRSDIYSLGATLFYMLTGRGPFSEGDMITMVASIAARPAVAPSKLNSKVPEELDRVVLRCLAKRPEERFSAYTSLREALTPTPPAPLSRRLAAGAIDGSLVIGWSLAWLGDNKGTFTANREVLDFLVGVAGATLLGFGEGVWGTSPGKFLLGLRVRRNLAPPGWRAGLVRGAVFGALQNVPILWILLIGLTQGWYTPFKLGSAFSIISPLALFLPFLFSRKSNGWTGIHDRLSKSRVTLKPRKLRRFAERTQFERIAPPLRRVGPFEVLGERPVALDGSDAKLLDGWDPLLKRNAWIVEHPAGTPQVSDERKNLQSPGRLRWLAGGHTPEGTWDAYESPQGEALMDLKAPVNMRRIPELLAGLSGVIEHAEPQELDLHRVWIGNNNRGFLCDFSVAKDASHRSLEKKAGFLRAYVRRMLGTDRFVLPLELGQTLFEVESGVLSHRDASVRFGKLPSSAGEVSRARRCGQLAISNLWSIILPAVRFSHYQPPRWIGLVVVFFLFAHAVASLTSPLMSGRPFSFLVTDLAFVTGDGTRPRWLRAFLRLAIPVLFWIILFAAAIAIELSTPPVPRSLSFALGYGSAQGTSYLAHRHPWALALYLAIPVATAISSIWNPYRGLLERLTGVFVCRAGGS